MQQFLQYYYIHFWLNTFLQLNMLVQLMALMLE